MQQILIDFPCRVRYFAFTGGLMHVLALCAGYGGLELGLDLAGLRPRTICHVEREAFAAAVLVDKMEKGVLAPAPVWSDLATFDGRSWCGLVDILTAGFPCQPWSCAGQRKGTDDDRWIWPDIARIIREVGPGLVFLENVPGLVRGGLAVVVGSLAEMGFDAEWGCFTAGAVGAPHRRERVFILGVSEQSRRPAAGERCDIHSGDEPEAGCGEVAHPEGLRGRESVSGEQEGERPEQDGPPLWPPGPSDDAGWRYILDRWPDLAPAVADAERTRSQFRHRDEAEQEGNEQKDRVFAQGGKYQGKAVEPPLCRVSDGAPHRVDRLRLLGNGVVPQQAALAFLVLADRLGLF